MGVAFPGESPEYRAARDRLLEQEIELRRAMEAVARRGPLRVLAIGVASLSALALVVLLSTLLLGAFGLYAFSGRADHDERPASPTDHPALLGAHRRRQYQVAPSS